MLYSLILKLGQERFGNMTRVYYKEAVGAMVVFDVTRIQTFEAASKWKNDIDSKVTVGIEEKPIPVILLANKARCTTRSFLILSRLISQRMDGLRARHKWISIAKKIISQDGKLDL